MKTSLLGMIALVSLAAPLNSASQTSAPLPKGAIAFVGSQRISVESNDGKAAVARLQALQQEKAADLRAKQQALEATRQRMAQSTDASSMAQLQRTELQQRTEVERATAQAQTEIQTLQRQLNAELQTKLKAVLDELLKGTDVQVVLQQETALLWAAPSLDLTTIVIERLNAKGEAAAK